MTRAATLVAVALLALGLAACGDDKTADIPDGDETTAAPAPAATEAEAAPSPEKPKVGKGKGAPDHWVAVVKPGRILYEIEGVDETTAREAMRLAAQKLPIKTKFVSRTEQEGGVV